MNIQELIQKHLPQDLWEVALAYQIPEDFLESSADLIEMVLRSKAIDKPEDKQSWFTLLPIMNDEQMAKLRDILVREKQKVAEIENKYEDEKVEVKKKYLSKRQQISTLQKTNEIKTKEAEAKAQEDVAAEALLSSV